MIVIHHAYLPHPLHDRLQSVCAAGAAQGITDFEAWVHQLEPGAATPTACHAGDQAVLALAGSGKLLIPQGPQRFSAPCTLLVPPGAAYEIVNTGSTTLVLVAVHRPTA